MPLVRIDLPAGTGADRRKTFGDVIYDAMAATMNVPPDDRFQIFTEHADGALVNAPAYLGIEKSSAAVIIQVTLNEGRTVEQKKGFYKAVAEGLHTRLDLRIEDVFINLVEVKKENWSFGNGIAQYA